MQFLSRTGFKQGLLSSPWWSSFCDGTYGNFLTASVFILFEAWARNQDYLHSHPKETLLQVGWPRSHSRHCELEFGLQKGWTGTAYAHHHPADCGNNQLYMYLSTPLVAPRSFTGLWIKETGNDLQWHNHFYSVKSIIPSDPETSFGLPHPRVHCFR